MFRGDRKQNCRVFAAIKNTALVVWRYYCDAGNILLVVGGLNTCAVKLLPPPILIFERLSS
jgi:hypothetical protein